MSSDLEKLCELFERRQTMLKASALSLSSSAAPPLSFNATTAAMPASALVANDSSTMMNSLGGNNYSSSSSSGEMMYESELERLEENKLESLVAVCMKFKYYPEPTNATVSFLTSHMLTKYCYPLLLLFGVTGNLLTFLVMCRVHKRKRSFQKFSLSLGTLALADLAILIFGCLIEYLEGTVSIYFLYMYLFTSTFFCCCFQYSSGFFEKQQLLIPYLLVWVLCSN